MPTNHTLTRPHHLLALVIGAVLAAAAMADASAQTAQTARELSEARHAAKEAKQQVGSAKAADEVQKYPQATRKPPASKASVRGAPKLSALVKVYQDSTQVAQARAQVDEILADNAANAFDHAFAAQVGAQVAHGQGDSAAAMAYLKQAIAADGLDNNGHYGAMYMLSQLQFQEQKYADALATLDKFLVETHTQDSDALALKGNMLYRLKRYPEAVAVLKQAIAAVPQPKTDWLQLLMGVYFDMNQPAQAAEIAAELGAKTPGDSRQQMNLASVYMQGGQNDKAAAILEKLRAVGQLTEGKDYRNLYALYLNMKGKEKDAVGVINEGLQKGVLEADYPAYSALAQAYYFSGQPGPAIDAYRKAAPLASDGETYLNLAKMLLNEGRVSEAKQAAQQALAKGVKNPADAKRILAAGGK